MRYKNKFTFLFICLLILSFFSVPIYAIDNSDELDNRTVEILLINSYHEGYKWSDDVEEALRAWLGESTFDIQITTFYLDTQRIQDNNPQVYFEMIGLAFKEKYKENQPDIILTLDDAAFQFIVEYCSFFDMDIPLFFCGVNDYNSAYTKYDRPISGIIEFIDYKATIELIKELKPETQKIYYIMDYSLTGKSLETYLLETYQTMNSDIELIPLEGSTLKAIAQKTSTLSEKDIVLFGVYFIDEQGNYYDYSEGVSEVSEKSKVPVFGLNDFTLGYGIIGGKMQSGERQGEQIAKELLNYLGHDNYEFKIIDANINQYMFDYNQLVRFGLSIEDIPYGSDVINYSAFDKKNVLLINSYNIDFQWTRNMVEGVEDALALYEENYEIYIENMDLKRVDSLQYINAFYELFMDKHELNSFDLILTTDDGAFEFAKKIVSDFEEEIPIVFCGVNYMPKEEIVFHEAYTGVIESYDLMKTIDSIVTLQPEVNRLYVINDNTATGVGNFENVESIKGHYPELEFEYCGDITMNELRDKTAVLNSQTAILLMSFNVDRANNYFSYSESVKTLVEVASVPMYAVWDFYLGEGIVGGYLTDGYQQGFTAGQLGIRVLQGEDIETLDIVTSSPNSYKFDYSVMQKFELSTKQIPDGSILINKKTNIYDIYNSYKGIFNSIFVILGVILIGFIIVTYFWRDSMLKNKKIKELATIDYLTGAYNRRTGIETLGSYVKNVQNFGLEIYIYFIDINNLKVVNDKYGHSEGDDLIVKVSNAIKDLVENQGIFCRMGGDEFMVAFIRSQESNPCHFSQNLKKHLVVLTEKSTLGYEYSVSVGEHRSIIEKDMDITRIIEEADAAMYRDKEEYKKKANQ